MSLFAVTAALLSFVPPLMKSSKQTRRHTWMSQLENPDGAGSGRAPPGCWGILHCPSFTRLHLSDSVGWFSFLLGAIETAQSSTLFHYNKSPWCGQSLSFLVNNKTYAIFSLSWSCFFNGHKVLMWTLLSFYFSSLSQKGKMFLGYLWSKKFWLKGSMWMMHPDSSMHWKRAVVLGFSCISEQCCIKCYLHCSSLLFYLTTFNEKVNRRVVISSSSYF